MQARVLDLDHSVVRQQRLLDRWSVEVVGLEDWGRQLRLACSFGSFRRFRRALSERLSPSQEPVVHFIGSGDFHHVSLALLGRLRSPCNLLVLDNHPDWVVRVPLLHCGTWLAHAARLPQVVRIFHVGGEVDFDNAYGWLAPWDLLRRGRITVFPASRRFSGLGWPNVPHTPLRPSRDVEADPARIAELLAPYREELERLPLYISLDKDVLPASVAPSNWDSGQLSLREVLDVIQAFLGASASLAGMDVVGDWSPVRVEGWLRQILARVEHPGGGPVPVEPSLCNERVNQRVLELVAGVRRSHGVALGY